MRAYLPALCIAFVASLAAMVYGALHRSPVEMAVPAFAFGILVVIVGIIANAPVWRDRVATTARHIEAVRDTADLTALLYAWGGAAMLLIYKFTGLHWRHGWQYGLGMLIIAAGIAAYIRTIAKRDEERALRSVDFASKIGALHGIAASIALLWLVSSGKLATPKDDWAANIVFVVGGLGIAGLSAIGLRTYARSFGRS